MAPSLDGRRFSSHAAVVGGDVGAETVFLYAERDGVISASYAGGAVVQGFLVGTRHGDRLDFRYAQLRTDGTTASGRCRSLVVEQADGRVRLEETWQWESAEGAGTSELAELPAPVGADAPCGA